MLMTLARAPDKKQLRLVLEDLYATYKSICEFRKHRPRSSNMLIKFFINALTGRKEEASTTPIVKMFARGAPKGSVKSSIGKFRSNLDEKSQLTTQLAIRSFPLLQKLTWKRRTSARKAAIEERVRIRGRSSVESLNISDPRVHTAAAIVLVNEGHMIVQDHMITGDASLLVGSVRAGIALFLTRVFRRTIQR